MRNMGAVSIRQIRCGTVNCCLVIQEGNAILVDTGTEKYREKVLAACKPYRIRLLVLTHGHIDHAQNAAFLASRLRVPVAMGKADSGLIEDNLSQPLTARGPLGKLVLAASMRSFHRDTIPPFTPEAFLQDGDSLDTLGIQAQIVALPGHTDGSIGIDAGGRAFLAGDALMNMLSPSLTLLYTNQQQAFQSAAKITALGDRTIYFGHGFPAQNRIWK